MTKIENKNIKLSEKTIRILIYVKKSFFYMPFIYVFSEKQLFPEKNSTELHSGNIVMMK